MAQAIRRHNDEYATVDLTDPAMLRRLLRSFSVDVFDTDGVGLLQLKLFEATTEDKLVQPTFIVAHPTDVSHVARASDADPAVTDRFELFITRREIANGFSELNDPETRRRASRRRRRRRKRATRKRCTTTPITSVRWSTGSRRRRGGHRHRPAGDAADRQRVDSRCDPVPQLKPEG